MAATPRAGGQPVLTPEGAIPAELVAAYRHTDYRVLHPRAFTLRIGMASAELKLVHADLGVAASAFLTAWNPFSQMASPKVNADAQAALIRRLTQAGHPVWRGLGIDPTGGWPGEESVFVPGLDLGAAKSLGRDFGQNAVVWCGADAVPRLVLLR